MSNQFLLVAAQLVHVGLVFVLLLRLGPARVAALRRGEVRLEDIALGQKAWPPAITQISNAYANQFELPMLFHIAALLALAERSVDPILVGLAWMFVLSRLAHAYVYVTKNHVPSRFRTFVIGVFALMAMWIWLAARLAVSALS